MTGLLHENAFSRTTFIKGGGALVIGFSTAAALAGNATAFDQGVVVDPLNPPLADHPSAGTYADRKPVNVQNVNALDTWITLNADNTVTVTHGETEVGHGTPTGILMLTAEELSMDFDQMYYAHPDSWLNVTGGGSGSSGISSRSTSIRAAGAYAYQYLLTLASQKLNVPVASLSVSGGVVSGGGQQMSYGELLGGQLFNIVMSASSPTPLGNPGQVSATPGQGIAKPVANYSVVGLSYPRIEIPHIATATLTYIQNLRVPGMLHMRRVRPRGSGAITFENDTPLSVDPTSIAHIPGAQVVQIGNFVSVVAPEEYNAIQAAAQLKVVWQTSQGFPQDSSNYWTWLRQAGDTNTNPVAKYSSDTGAVPAALAGAVHTISATYHYHYNTYVPIGPHCAVGDVQLSQNLATAFLCGQALTGIQANMVTLINNVTGVTLPVQNCRAVWYEGAGSFGSGQEAQAYEEAVMVSAKLGVPVRNQWMRWDQQGWDHWGPSHMADVTAGADNNGNIVAFDWVSYAQAQSNLDEAQRLVGLLAWSATPGGNGMSPSDSAVYNTTGYGTKYQYQRRVLSKSQPLYGGSIDCNFIRAPLAPQTYFMSEQAVDELAHAAGWDPIAFRRNNIDPTAVAGARWLAVMDGATLAANWQPRVANSIVQTGNVRTGRGFGFGTFASTQVGIVADVEVNMTTGKLVAKHLYIAQNNGITIGPQLVANQMSGSAIMGVSRCMVEEATWNTERLTTVDWVTYPILRIADAPSVTLVNVHPSQYVTVIPGDMTTATNPGSNVQAGNSNAFAEGWTLTGSGEPPLAAVGSAIANAFFDASGARIRETPMNPPNVRGALKAAGLLA